MNNLPDNLPHATTDPVKVTAPIATVIANVDAVKGSTASAGVVRYCAIATKKEDKPPKPLKRATN